MHAAHAARAPRRSAGHRRPVRRILGVTAAFGAAIVLAGVATAGTYALWNAQVDVNASTITSGSMHLSVNGESDYTVPDLSLTPLLPGRSVVSPEPLLLENTGTTPLSATLAGTVFLEETQLTPYLTVVLRPGATCNATPDGGTAPAAWAGSLALAPGQSAPMCLEVTLSRNAPASVQGATATFALTLNAVQVPRS